MDRQVTILASQDDQQRMINETNYDEYYRAIGRLSTWGMGIERYAHVTILLIPSELEIRAVYKAAPDDKAQFVIGAVWHGDHFGFHS